MPEPHGKENAPHARHRGGGELTSTLALTAVATASATVARAADAASATTPRPATAAALPAVPDTRGPDLQGALGGVLNLVDGIVSSASPTAGLPDPAALQKQIAALQAAIQGLLGKLSASPVSAVPTVPTASLPGDVPRHLQLPSGTPSVLPARAPLPAPAPSGG
ncbi:hypothetical protein [Saccharothrix sp. ST-888]|uniref:hypothetical protein n=1 Tax=Saccharothrix sp. ST-888 TaxID=1427391 RepID=UPI0005EC3359|nr:hypothetical protein [Saccharothrix sp. ST-888]KJK56907.1 hypothetical protein UK12_19715 [Saccharothrix sp. ST-888]